ncbi:MAG: sigma-54-dependent Fis family transcriptional regulator [Candidatus Hydrogenedentes bacterium]|nr:sigma-54-dependent Fis family transcriptional regulator [Candidatus Hydrogenedentota bacterium]
MRILVIDDDRALCRSLQIHLEHEGHTVAATHTAADGRAALDANPPELLFLDLQLPDSSGLEVLRGLKEAGNGPLVVMITGMQDAKATIEAVRLGAFDYIRKPLDLDAVMLAIEKAGQRLSAAPARKAAPIAETADRREIVGAHPKIIDVLKQIGLLSESRVPVLIQGESGTGKEIVARALHEASAPNRPFVAINCSAVVSTLLESELFGHVRGAFTGADSAKTGKLEAAGEGTVFLDEIGDMSYDLQAKLLRAVQEREFEPVGGTRTIPFKARVIAATHRNLEQMMADNTFRDDLYYRLAVTSIQVPPLRERRSDIPLLVEHILGRVRRELHLPVSAVEEAALRRLQTYAWPGNVRELENVLTRAALLARGSVVTEESVAASMGQAPAAPAKATEVKPLWQAEKDHIEMALYSTGWNITQTAVLLDISPTTLRKKIHDFSLTPPTQKA